MPTSRGDLLLVQRAIRAGWPVPAHVRATIVAELADGINSPNVRLALAAGRAILAMEGANIRAEKIG